MTKASKSEAPTPTADGGWLTRYLFRPKTLLLLAIVVSLTAVLPMIARVLPNLSSRPEYQVRTSNIEISDPPPWVPSDLVKQVVKRAGLPDEVSLLDEELTQEVAEAFRHHPWVADVIRVEKSVPSRIRVELSYRRPVAMVQVKQGMYPIDPDGILLPPADFSVSDTELYPVIRNISSTPQGPAGTRWGEIGAVGAARLADVLGPYWERFGLAAIHVPRRIQAEVTLDEIHFSLITKGGSRIIWGRAPGVDHPGELSVEQKIGRLEQYLADFGVFDHPHGPYEIDIRHWKEISRRPLSARKHRLRR